nr:hypothetical protein [Tanacetum cinerariifolium]
MAFLTAIASSRFPSTYNQLRTSSNSGNQATIQDGRVAIQQVQPKRPRNATWFKEMAMLAKAQEVRQTLDEEQLAFLADACIPDGFKWKPTGRLFTIVGNSCPSTRITSKKIMHLKETTSNSVKTPKPKIKVYSRKPKKIKPVCSSKKAKIVESKNAKNSKPNHLWGSNATYVPYSSCLVNDRLSKLSSGRGGEVLSGGVAEGVGKSGNRELVGNQVMVNSSLNRGYDREENMISNEYAVKLCLEHEVKKGNKVVKKELNVSLRDTGSDINTMPYRIYEQLGREEMKKVDRGITMINHTQAEVMGILTNALCQVGVTTLIAKFLILYIPIDRDSPILVGQGFLQSDSNDEEEYQIKRNKFGTPIYGPKPASYLNCNDPAERSLWEHTMMRPNHHDPNALDNMKPWKRYCFYKFTMSSCYGKDVPEMQSLEDVVRSLSALVYCRDFDTTTLRDLIESEGKLILEDPKLRVPRMGIPRPPRASIQDLYDRIEIRQAVERMEYKQSYHWDRYQGVFEHMARVYNVPL